MKLKRSTIVTVLALAIIVIAPVLYIYTGTPSESDFAKIKVGDSEDIVLSLLGKPKRIETKGPFLSGVDFEYEYYVFPIPVVMCVGCPGGVVNKTYVMQSP
jgi:hypothetical protein